MAESASGLMTEVAALTHATTQLLNTVNVRKATQYVDRIQVVREKGDPLIQEIPVYVPVQADAACTVHRGFVSLHDAAAAGELPTTPRDADAPAEGLALSAVAVTVVSNYQTCHENAEQLKALQDWIRQTR